MTRVGDELPHPVFRPEGTCLALFARPVRGLDPAEHGVQRIGQTADLGAARGMVDAPRKVTAGDRRGRRLDPAERCQADAHERQPDACQHRDRDRPGQRIRYLQASDGAIEIIEAECDDHVPTAGERLHQDTPGMRRRAGRRRGERAPLIPELRRGQPRGVGILQRRPGALDLPVSADHLDQELRRQGLLLCTLPNG